MSATETESPSWFGKAAALFGAGGATVAGVTIWENPSAWVLAVVSDFVVDGVLSLGQQLGGLVILVNNQITGAFGESGGAILGAFGTVGDLVLGGYGAYADAVASVAAAAGPFSFVVTLVGFGLAVLAGSIVVSGIIRLVVVVT